MTIKEACEVDPSFYLHVVDEKPQLKKNHHHFYQIQVLCLRAELIGGTLLFIQQRSIQ